LIVAWLALSSATSQQTGTAMQTPATAPAAFSVAPTETITVTEPVVACDGGGGALGHPRVFLKLVKGSIVCPYCSRLFVLSPSPGGF